MIAGTESASTFAAQLCRAKSPIPTVIRLIPRLIGMASLCKKVFSALSLRLQQRRNPPLVLCVSIHRRGSGRACPEAAAGKYRTFLLSSDFLYLVQVSAVAFRGHVVAMHETQRSRVDAVAQSALVARAILEDMA